MSNISYDPLFKLLIDKHMKKTELAKVVGISTATLAKLSRNESVSLDILVRICQSLDCRIEDVIEVLPRRTCDTQVNDDMSRGKLYHAKN